jgi:hypothetical protein
VGNEGGIQRSGTYQRASRGVVRGTKDERWPYLFLP